MAILVGGAVVAVAAVVTAMGFAVAAQKAPRQVVWASLLLGPTFLVIEGTLLILGPLVVTCVVFAYRGLVAFTIIVLQVLAAVLRDHPDMIRVSLFGSVLNVAWLLACIVGFIALITANGDTLRDAGVGQWCGILFGITLVMV